MKLAPVCWEEEIQEQEAEARKKKSPSSQQRKELPPWTAVIISMLGTTKGTEGEAKLGAERLRDHKKEVQVLSPKGAPSTVRKDGAHLQPSPEPSPSVAKALSPSTGPAGTVLWGMEQMAKQASAAPGPPAACPQAGQQGKDLKK